MDENKSKTYYVVEKDGWYYNDHSVGFEPHLRMATLLDTESEARYWADLDDATVRPVTLTVGEPL